MKKKSLKDFQNEAQKRLLSKAEEKQVKGGFIVIDDINGN